MANRNIQMKKRTGDNWDNLYPITLDSNVFDENGNSVKSQLAQVQKLTKKITVDDLPLEGIVSAHRGGGATGRSPVAADNGFSGYDMAIRLGAHILDVDCRTTADGVMIAMHDVTVNRTTNGEGNVSDHLSSALPLVSASKYCGVGWKDEPVPTIEEILIRYGGRVIITIEPKEGLQAVKPLSNLIKKYNLEKSVFINTNNISVAEEIVNNGCLVHFYGCNTVEKVIDAANAGAWLIEVPYNASHEIVNTALNSSIKRVIAGPVWTRTQVQNMTEGIQGHVTDAVGMTNRRTGDEPLVKSILPSLKSNKRGIGWIISGEWVIEDQSLKIKRRDEEYGGGAIYLGDMSGNMPSTYSIRFKVKPSENFVGKNSGARLRICATIPNQNAHDSTTDGYVCNLRGSGVMNLWTSSGNFGPGILLGETSADDGVTTPLVAGQEYTVRIDITPTTIKMTREDTNQVLGPYNNTDWRGDNIYAWIDGPNESIEDVAFTDITIF